MNNDLHHSDTKPEVCWQLPIRRIPVTDDEGEEFTRLTEFARDGWGEGGEDFGWWCTEAPEAFVNTRARVPEPRARAAQDARRPPLRGGRGVPRHPDGAPGATAGAVVHPAQAPSRCRSRLGPSRNGTRSAKRKARAERD